MVRQREPLLHKVNPQHRAQRKRRSAGAAFWVVGGNEFHQSSPRNHFLHLLQEFAFARLFGVEVEVQRGLFHGLYFLKRGLHQAHRRGSYAEFS